MKIIIFKKKFEKEIKSNLDVNLQNRLYEEIYSYNFMKKSSNLENYTQFKYFRLSEYRIIFTEIKDKIIFISVMKRNINYHINEIKKWRKIILEQ